MGFLDIFRRATKTPRTDPFITEDRGDGTVSLTLTGLASKGTLDLRIDGIPQEIQHAVRDLLLRLSEVAARQSLRKDGETVGGPLVDDLQPVMHMATLRVASRSTAPGSDEIFRVVDYGADVAAGLPSQLLATHLALWNRSDISRRQRIHELEWSVRLFPGTPATGDVTFAFDRGENVGNWAGWNALGELLVEAGQIERGLECLREAALRCPPWADDFARHVKESVQRTGADVSDDPRLQFWLRVNSNR